MGDEKLGDFAARYLPDAVRREMERQKREESGKAVAPPIEEATGEPEPESLPPLERLSPLPLPGDPYKAHARPANQMVPTLMVLTGDGKRWGFSYACRMDGPHLAAGEAGEGDILLMRFNVGVLVEVRLAGHRLDELHNYLGEHRIRWVREVPPGRIIQAGGLPLITRVKIAKADAWPPVGVG